jgi:hypothetical protein
MNKLLWIQACALLCLAATGPSSAQTCSPDKPTVGQPWTGQPGITESVGDIMAREAANPERYDGKPRLIGPEHEVDRNWVKPNPLAPPVSSWPPLPTGPGGHGGGPYNPQIIGLNFNGPNIAATPGYIPPDVVGDVGPTQIMVTVNGRVITYNKSTGVADGALNATTDTFFNSVRNASGCSDPMVRYDRTSGRWFVSIVNVATPNRVLLAVSSGPTIVNTASFTFYFFQHDLVGTTPNSDTGGFCDYPSLGVDANAVYIGGNIFNAAGTTFLGTTGYVIRKSSVTSGGPIVVTAFRQMVAGAAGAGPFGPRGVSQDDPSATEGYFVGVDNATFSTLMVRRISTPGGTPTISGNLSIVVPTTVFPISSGTPALGSSTGLSGLDDRLFQAQMRKNRLTGLTTLWSAHNIQVTAAGVASNTGGRNGSRWYELQNMTGVPSLRQSGTLFDSAATSPKSYWIPSVAMSGQGHMALGSSMAGAADRAGVATAGRFGTDTLGTIQAPSVVIAGVGSYNAGGGNPQRWGDYSHMAVDPMDDMTIWGFQEYCDANNSWCVRVFKLIAPPPATIVSLSPNSLAQGATSNITVTGSSSSGSGFFDTEPGMNRLVAAFSGSGVTVNSVTFNNPTSATLNVTVSGGAATGFRNLTMTNPDGQQSSLSNALNITSSAVNVPPATMTVSPGVILSGGFADVLTSDDSRLVVRPGAVFVNSTPPIQVTFEATAPGSTISQMTINFEGQANANNVLMVTSAYNFTTNQFDQVDSRNLTLNADSSFSVNVPNPADYLDGARLMRMKFACKATAAVFAWPYVLRLDAASWTIAP